MNKIKSIKQMPFLSAKWVKLFREKEFIQKNLSILFKLQNKKEILTQKTKEFSTDYKTKKVFIMLNNGTNKEEMSKK